MVTVDEVPEIRGLGVLGADEPVPSNFEDIGSLLFVILRFELFVSQGNTDVPFNKLPRKEGLLSKDPKPREGDVIFRKSLDGQAQVNNDHVDFV